MIIRVGHGSSGFLGVVWYDARCEGCGRQVTDVNSDLHINTETGTVTATCKDVHMCARARPPA